MAEIRVADTDTVYEDALSVRYRVFVDEQGVDPDLEVDDYEAVATHFVAYQDDEPVGAARLRAITGEGSDPAEEATDGEVAKIERVAVLESRHKQGIGRDLMDAAEAEARKQGFTEARLHSQTSAVGFYERLGYEQVGEQFEEAGIPHVAMRKSL